MEQSAKNVEQMAIQAREIARTDYSVAFTGVAGPDTLEGQSAGTVWIAISSKDGVVSENITLPEIVLLSDIMRLCKDLIF